MKTPEELQLTEEQFNSLVAVLGKMDRGELVRTPRCEEARVCLIGDDKGNGFNMDQWECGTAACIGGWAERLAGKRVFASCELLGSRGLNDLLFPTRFCLSYDDAFDATPQHAAVALRSYLETGAPDWTAAMNKSSS